MANHGIRLSMWDKASLFARIKRRDKRKGPRIGDFVRHPKGFLERFTHAWDSGKHAAADGFGHSSFYLHLNADGDKLENLNPLVSEDKLIDTGEAMDGDFWFFHDGHVRAYNGVDVKAPCRIFEVL